MYGTHVVVSAGLRPAALAAATIAAEHKCDSDEDSQSSSDLFADVCVSGSEGG